MESYHIIKSFRLPEKVDLGYATSLQPKDAIAYFRNKGYRITFDWHEMLEDAHTRAFTVAKAAKHEILKTIYEAQQKALTQGITEQQFIKELEPQLRKLGWWGKKAVKRPDGTSQLVQLGSHRRLKTIYRTNVMSAYNAGRYKQMEANATNPLLPRPYWQYVAVIDSRTRHAHRELHGKVFRYDDPFWNTFYPPNGWNCRCRVTALTADELAAEGLRVENGAKGLRPFRQTVATDKVTGEVIKIDATRYHGRDAAGKPFAIAPDAGFGYNPGKGWARWDNIDAPGSNVIAAGQKTFREHGLSKMGGGSERMSLLPIRADSVEDAHKKLANEIMGDADYLMVDTPVDPVVFRREWLWHIVVKRNDRRERHARHFLRTFEDPNEVWLVRYEDGRFRRVFIKRFEDEANKSFFIAVARENIDSNLVWTGFSSDKAKRVNKLRVGVPLYIKK